MILINMMMAIINLAFEEIKSNESDYQNRFELVDYIKRTIQEMIGIQLAQPIVPVYLDESEQALLEMEEEEQDPTEEVSKDFTAKTDQLLKYIEQTYLDGFVDDNGENFMKKMKNSDPDDKKIMNYGFDALFMDGPEKKDD